MMISASLFSGCGNDEQQAQQMNAVQVKTMMVIQQDTPIAAEYAGKIVGKNEVYVQSKVSGKVVEKYVTGGQMVQAGQPLYRIDSRQYEWRSQRPRSTMRALIWRVMSTSTSPRRFRSNP